MKFLAALESKLHVAENVMDLLCLKYPDPKKIPAELIGNVFLVISFLSGLGKMVRFPLKLYQLQVNHILKFKPYQLQITYILKLKLYKLQVNFRPKWTN